MFLQMLLAKSGINLAKTMFKSLIVNSVNNFSPQITEKIIEEISIIIDNFEKPLLYQLQVFLSNVKDKVNSTPNIIDNAGYLLLKLQLKKLGDNFSKIADLM